MILRYQALANLLCPFFTFHDEVKFLMTCDIRYFESGFGLLFFIKLYTLFP